MVSVERIEHAIKSNPEPVVTVLEVVELVDADVSDTHIRNQMRVLEAAGKLASKDVGARAVAWWHTDRVTPPVADPAEHPDQAGLDDVAEPESDESDETPEWLESLGTPPSSDREAFEAAARALINEIQERGTITRSEAVDALHDTHADGYAENARTWWRRLARPTLDAHPDVEPPAAGASKWRYQG